ncbi:hypothetical protein LINPERHAP2_LOCUS27718 [Linum perenne]
MQRGFCLCLSISSLLDFSSDSSEMVSPVQDDRNGSYLPEEHLDLTFVRLPTMQMLKGFVRLLRGGVVNLYMEATNDASFMADNEDSDSGNNHAYATSDPNAEGSGIRANQNVIHLIHDSDRTSDPEFQEAMKNMGISAMRRRKVRVSHLPDNDIKVEQLNELTVNGAQQEEVIVEVEGPNHMDQAWMKSVEFDHSNSDADDEDSDL